MATQLSGANKERDAWMAKLKRMMREDWGEVRADYLLEKLHAWGLKRNERYNSRKGGLQR